MANIPGSSAVGKVICASVHNVCEDANIDLLVPVDSQDEYATTLRNFNTWRKENKISELTEDTFLAYFRELAEVNKPLLLWKIYSMLKTIILQIENVNIGSYERLKALFKNYATKKIKPGVFTIENVKTFLEGPDDAPYLGMKVALVISLAGACYREELASLKIEHVRIEYDKAIIDFPSQTNFQGKRFEITGKCFTVLKKYADLRPGDVPGERFLVGSRHGKFTTVPMQIKTISKIPRKIATFLKLPSPETYNGHCFKRTSIYLDKYFQTCKSEVNGNNITIRPNICNLIMESDDNITQNNETHDIEHLEEKLKYVEKELKEDISYSRSRYPKELAKFNKWRQENNLSDLTEETFLAYFRKLSEVFRPRTLKVIYAMLRSKFLENGSLDLANYTGIRAFLKARSSEGGVGKKKNQIFSKEDVTTFLENADDFHYLGIKAVLVIGLAGACKATELVDLKKEFIQIKEDKAIIKIPTRLYSKGKIFELTGNFFTVFKKYADMRPTDISENRFLVSYRLGKCMRVVMGKHAICEIPKKVASFLELPNSETFTVHAIRLTTLKFCSKFKGSLDKKLKKFEENFMDESVFNKNVFTPSTSKVFDSINDMDQYDDLDDKSELQQTELNTIHIDLSNVITNADCGLLEDDDPLKL